MATNQELIQQQRRNIEQARKQVEEATRREKVSKAQLLQRQGGLAARAQRQAQAAQKRKAYQQAQTQIRAQEKAFETQVAQQAPEYAKKQYLETAYQTARSAISKKFKAAQGRLVSAQEYLKRIQERGEDDDEAQVRVRSLGAEAGIYGASLSGSKINLVKNYYSGATERGIESSYQKIEGAFERAESKRAFARQQGFSTFIEYQKAYGVQQEQIALAAKTQPGIISQVRQPGVATYDVSTGTYTSAEGYQSSIPLEHIPPGTQITGPISVQQPQYTPFSQYQTPTQQINLEIQRYKDMGYTATQAQRIVTESTRLQQDLTSKYAKQIGRVTIPERLYGGVQDITKVYTGAIQAAPAKTLEALKKTVGFVSPVTGLLLEREVKVSLGPTLPVVGGLLDVPMGVSYGEAATIPKQTIEWTAETAGAGWEDIYGETITKLPEEYQPTFIIPEKREEYKREIEKVIRGETTYDPEVFEKLTVKVTPEQFGTGIETTLKLGAYAVPYVGVTYLGSQFVSGVEDIRKPEEKAKEIVKEAWVQYEKDYSEQEARLELGYELGPKLTFKELEAQLMPEAIQQVRQSGAVEAALSGAFLGGVGAIKVYQFGTRPVTKITPTRVLKEEGVISVEAQPIFIGGEKLVPTKIMVKGKKRPPLLIEETTPFRDLFGMKPLKIKEVPAIEYQQVSINPLTGKRYVDVEKPFLMMEKETGKRYATLFEVEGTATPKDLKAFMKLPKEVRYKWQKLAEKKAGQAIPEKLVPKFFKEEAQLFKGEEVAKRLFRFKPGKEITKITVPWKPGKRITQAESVMEIVPLKTKLSPLKDKIELIKEAEIFKIGIVSKDITKAVPFKRAAGKVDKTTGILIIRKPVDLTAGKTYGIQPAQIKKTSLDETFQVQVQKAVLDLKLPPSPKPSKIPIAKVVDIKPLPDVLPKMVSGVGLTTVPYEGMGLYEVAEAPAVRMAPIVKPSLVDMEVTGLRIEPTFKVIPLQPVLVREGIREELKIMPRLKVVEDMGLQLREEFLIETLPRLRMAQVPTQEIGQRVRQQLALKTDLRLQQIQVPRIVTRPVTRVPRAPVRPPKRIPLLLRRNNYVPIRGPRLRPEVPKQGYNFEVRRKGKWERFKTPFAFATKEGAEARAQDVVLKEAAASYKIVKARKGKRVVKSGRKLSPFRKFLFRPGKEPGVKVQKKKLRILTPGEKKEISYAGGIARMRQAQSKPVKKKTSKKKKKGGKK